MGVGTKTRLATSTALVFFFFFLKLYADVRENNILSPQFKLAWDEDCSKNKKKRYTQRLI